MRKWIALVETLGAIESVTEPADLCAPIVITPKKGSYDVRLCVDFLKLNKHILREYCHSCSSAEAIADINASNCKYFTMFDAIKEYHQCPLD